MIFGDITISEGNRYPPGPERVAYLLLDTGGTISINAIAPLAHKISQF